MPSISRCSRYEGDWREITPTKRQADRRTQFNRKNKSRRCHAIREMRKAITGKNAKAASKLHVKFKALAA